MARAWAEERKIDVIQVVYSLLNRESTELIDDLGKAGIGIVARESLANGFLSGSVRRDSTFTPGRSMRAITEKKLRRGLNVLRRCLSSCVTRSKIWRRLRCAGC